MALDNRPAVPPVINPVQILYKQNDRITGTSPVRTTSHLREFNAAVLRPAILRPVRHRRGKHPDARQHHTIPKALARLHESPMLHSLPPVLSIWPPTITRNSGEPFSSFAIPSFLNTTFPSRTTVLSNSFICTMEDSLYRRKADPCSSAHRRRRTPSYGKATRTGRQAEYPTEHDAARPQEPLPHRMTHGPEPDALSPPSLCPSMSR